MKEQGNDQYFSRQSKKNCDWMSTRIHVDGYMY